MQSPIKRVSEKVSRVVERDPTVTGKSSVNLMCFYLYASHIPRTLEYSDHKDGQAGEKEWKRDTVVQKHCKDLMELVGWVNKDMEVFDVINLKNLNEKVAAAPKEFQPKQRYLAIICDKAYGIWQYAQKNVLIPSGNEAYKVYPRFEEHQEDHSKNWYPMYHYIVQKFNEDDLCRICTTGFKGQGSPCLFLKNHNSSKKKGYCHYTVKESNMTRWLSFMFFNLCPRRFDRTKLINLKPSPEGTYPGCVKGVCCNPYHYMTPKELHTSTLDYDQADRLCHELSDTQRKTNVTGEDYWGQMAVYGSTEAEIFQPTECPFDNPDICIHSFEKIPPLPEMEVTLQKEFDAIVEKYKKNFTTEQIKQEMYDRGLSFYYDRKKKRMQRKKNYSMLKLIHTGVHEQYIEWKRPAREEVVVHVKN